MSMAFNNNLRLTRLVSTSSLLLLPALNDFGVVAKKQIFSLIPGMFGMLQGVVELLVSSARESSWTPIPHILLAKESMML